MKDVFTEIYQKNFWKSDQSVSGTGSTLDATGNIRMILPQVFKELKVRSVLDIPCGDFNWFKEMWHELDLDDYIGADIVPELIAGNCKYLSSERSFEVIDITTDRLPEVDLIFCRDLLGHLSNLSVQRALKNIKRSGATWLMATTFPEHETTGDIRTGEWRPINLQKLWGLPKITSLIDEHCEVPGFEDKSLGLWKL